MILLKIGETVLKGQNRRIFEKKLLENIRRRLKPVGSFNVYTMQSAIYVEPQKSVNGGQSLLPASQNTIDMNAALETVKTIFGIAKIARAEACGKDKNIIVKAAASYLGDELKKVKTFKVESKRADKKFSMNSIELSQYVGGELHEMYPHLTADMHNPELLINIEIRENAAYIHGPAIRGAGGLPVGTGGDMVALLSGGIDSPAAMYMMARRGVRLTPVHFYSHPYTSVQAKEKVVSLAKHLEKYCGSMKTILVPFTEIQEEIRKKCPEPLMTVIMRRFMVRIAEQIAKQRGCSALVTGDNLGQVASQTAEAIAVCDACISLPIFRPLLAFDKIDIIELAREIGTFDTSVLPYEDCCTVFTPRRPRTKPKLFDVEAAEAKLDANKLIENALIEIG